MIIRRSRIALNDFRKERSGIGKQYKDRLIVYHLRNFPLSVLNYSFIITYDSFSRTRIVPRDKLVMTGIWKARF